MLSLTDALAWNAGRPRVGRVFRFHRTARRIARTYETAVATAWMRALGRVQAGISDKALRTALTSKNLVAAEAAIGASSFGQMMRDLEDPLARTAAATGTASAKTLTAGGYSLGFNATHPNVILYARDQSATLVRGVTATAREAIRTVIALGAQEGLTIEAQARAIREVVGLPPSWAASPLHLEQELRRGDAAAATARRLSAVDKQQIRSRIAAGTVDEKFIAECRARYTASLINRRALNIARTETIGAANWGQQESWRQGVAGGHIPRGAKRFWLATPSSTLCHHCAEIPGLNPSGRGIEEPFLTPFGERMLPPAHPNCRCGIGLAMPPREARREAARRAAKAAKKRGGLVSRALRGTVPGRPAGLAEVPTLLPAENIPVPAAERSLAGLAKRNIHLDEQYPDLTLGEAARGIRVQQTVALANQASVDVTRAGFQLPRLRLRLVPRGSLSDSEVGLFHYGLAGGDTVVFPAASLAEMRATLTPLVRTRWFATRSVKGIAQHELGHALHARSLERYLRGEAGEWMSSLGERWSALTKALGGGVESPEMAAELRLIAREVSGYAAISPSEFVAEMFTGLLQGERYSTPVMQLYRDLHGPISKRWRHLFADTSGRRGGAWLAEKRAAGEVGERTMKHATRLPTVVERKALGAYRGERYAEINAAARGLPRSTIRKGTLTPKQVERAIRALDAIAARTPPITDTQFVWRGGARLPTDLRAGQTFVDRGFVSTSREREAAQRFMRDALMRRGDPPVMVRIARLPGSRGIDMESILGARKGFAETEVILPRGTHFKVTRVRQLTAREYEAEFGRGTLPVDVVQSGQRIRVVDVEVGPRAIARERVLKAAKPPSARAGRAIQTHKPATAAKQRAGDQQQRVIARAVQGDTTKDNAPLDILTVDLEGRRVGIEVKTFCDQVNSKVTMHPASLRRKTAWARKNKSRLATVVVDAREDFGFHSIYSGTRYYVRKGVGSFRLKTMEGFDSLEEATNYIKSGFKRVAYDRPTKPLGRLKGAERDAFHYYQRGDAYEINQWLRKGDKAYRKTWRPRSSAPAPEAIEQWTATLDRVMARAPEIGRERVVWRGANLPRFRVGEVFTDKGFVSTSSNRAVTQRFIDTHVEAGKEPILLRIVVPKTQRGVFMDEVLGKPEKWMGEGLKNESELLLPRGTTFRVTRVRHLTVKEYEAEFGKLTRRVKLNLRSGQRIAVTDLEVTPRVIARDLPGTGGAAPAAAPAAKGPSPFTVESFTKKAAAREFRTIADAAEDLKQLVPDADVAGVEWSSPRCDLNKAHAFFDPVTREVHLSRDASQRLVAFWQGDRAPRTVDAVRTLVHEYLHSTSPMLRARKMEGWWAFLEEGMVEQRARAATLQFMFPQGKALRYTFTSYTTEVEAVEWLQKTFGRELVDQLWGLDSAAARTKLLNTKMREWLLPQLRKQGLTVREAQSIATELGDDAWHILRTGDQEFIPRIKAKALRAHFKAQYGVEPPAPRAMKVKGKPVAADQPAVRRPAGVVAPEELFGGSPATVGRRIGEKKVEWAHGWDRDGRMRWSTTSNKPSVVKYKYSDGEAIKDGVFVHNHPDGSSFSALDIECALKHSWREMWAVNPEGSFRVVRPAQGWPSWTTIQEAKVSAERALRQAHEALRVAQPAEYGIGTEGWRLWERDFTHDTWVRVFQELGIHYERFVL